MKNFLAVLGLLLLAPFALAAALVLLIPLSIIFMLAVKLIFVIGGALVVLAVGAAFLGLLVEEYDEDKAREAGLSGTD